MIEIWKDIPGYEGLYQVSNYGRVLSLYRYRKKSKNILKTFTRKTGYIAVTLQKNGKRETKLVHQLVALCFIDNPNNYPIINHIDENPSNNRVDNLEWCTHKYNSNYGTGKLRCAAAHHVACACYKDGKLIKEYPSIESTKKDGFVPHAVCWVCKGNRARHYGLEWRYVRKEGI